MLERRTSTEEHPENGMCIWENRAVCSDRR